MARMRITGRLSPDNQLTLRPAYSSEPTQYRRALPREYNDAYADTLDSTGRVLTRSPVRLVPLSESPNRILKGLIELPADAVTLVISLRDTSGGGPIEIGRYLIPGEAPSVTFERQPEAMSAGRQHLAWTVTGTAAPVEFLVDYSWDGGRSWQPVSHRLTGTECDVDFDQLPGGEECVIAVSATNGFRSSTVMSDAFHVATKSCRAMIVQPVAEQTCRPETTLIGNGYWLEEASIELKRLRWVSDVDGELGEGNSVPVRLSQGEHQITLIAGSREREGRQTVHVVVLDDAVPANLPA